MNAITPEDGKGGAANAPDPVTILTASNNTAATSPDQAVPPYATVAPTLLNHGYEPVPIRPNSKAPIPPAWSHPDAPTFTRWQQDHPHAGTGLLTRHTPAADLDILDPAAADAVEALCRQKLGDTVLRRVGQEPKRTLFYRTSTPFPKLKVVLLAPDGVEHKIEMLADGQQSIIFGIHPDTGQPFTWRVVTPADVPSSFLPEITEEMVVAFLTAAADLLIGQFGYQRKSSPARNDTAPPPPLAEGEAARIADALRYIRSDDRGDYVKYGEAIKSALGDAGFAIFDRWSQQTKSNNYDKERTETDWNSFKPRSITVLSIYYAARRNGWVDTSGFTKPSNLPATPPTITQDGTVVATKYDIAGMSYKTPLYTAQIYVGSSHMVGGIATLRHHNGVWRKWTGTHYAVIEEGAIQAELWPFLQRAFDVTRSRALDVLAALKTQCHLPISTTMPCWLSASDDNPPANEILPCANGLLHLKTMVLYPPNPAFFSANALDYGYDPAAPPPTQWLCFLRTLWPDDPEVIEVLQELFGYYLTGDTRQQKIALVVGPRRSGKGTIARVLTGLIGRDNVCSPTLDSLCSNFGLAPLIDKPLAIIPDARLSGRTDQSPITERLLSISGEDGCTIDRKHMSAWSGRLPTRFLVMTNELPRINDASGALASRFIILTMRNSFYGSEDHGLTDRLLAELPGILNWAITGWQRLQKRGHLVQPKSSADTIQALEDLSSPIGAFLRDRCQVSPGATVSRDAIYDSWVHWCASQGRGQAGNAATFGRDLRSAVPCLTDTKIHGVRHYSGLRLCIV